MWGVEGGVIVAMIIVNSVFAAYEIALVSVSITRVQSLVREGRPGAKAALEMKERMEASLAVVQMGITLVGATGAATGGAGASEAIDTHAKPMENVLHELHAIAALARTSRLIGGREEGIILNAARLSSRPVREIVLPAEHIAMLNLADSLFGANDS